MLLGSRFPQRGSCQLHDSGCFEEKRDANPRPVGSHLLSLPLPEFIQLFPPAQNPLLKMLLENSKMLALQIASFRVFLWFFFPLVAFPCAVPGFGMGQSRRRRRRDSEELSQSCKCDPREWPDLHQPRAVLGPAGKYSCSPTAHLLPAGHRSHPDLQPGAVHEEKFAQGSWDIPNYP